MMRGEAIWWVECYDCEYSTEVDACTAVRHAQEDYHLHEDESDYNHNVQLMCSIGGVVQK